MIPALQSGLSGAKAFQRQVDAAARNVANVATNGYRKERVAMTEDRAGGVATQSARVETPGPTVVDPGGADGVLVELSNVDLAEELTGMLIGERGFELNLKTVKTADEMLGALLDLKG